MLCSLLQQESENTIKVAAIGLIRTLPLRQSQLGDFYRIPELSLGFGGN